jgi:hypothetical protein
MADIANFLAQNSPRYNRAAIDREHFGNALLKNDVDRLPQRNAAEDAAIAADQQSVTQDRTVHARKMAADIFTAIADSPDPISTGAMLTQSGAFRSVGADLGLPVDQFRPTHGDDPEQIRAAARSWAQAVGAQSSGSMPAELETFNAMTQGMPGEDVDQAKRVRLGLQSRAGATRIVSIGNVPHVVGVDDGGQPFQIPLSNIQNEASGRAQVAGAEASARAGAEAQAARTQKTPALASLDYVAEQFMPVLRSTPTGGFMGGASAVGSVFDYQDASRFDNLREQMSTELRTVFRIPGEGTLSDREQAQYGLQLPDRKYSPTVNEAIIADIRNRASIRVTGGVASSGGAPQVGEVQDGYRFKGGDPSQQTSWERVQ